MHGFRSNLRQRLQHKTAMLHCWMREAKFLCIQNFVAKKDNIHVDGSRPLWLGPLSSHRQLNREQTLKKLQRGQFGFHGRCTVQKPGLLAGDFYRLRLIKGRNLTDCAQFTQAGDCLTKIGFAVTQIRAQREVCSPFHGKNLRSEVPSPDKSPARYVGYLVEYDRLDTLCGYGSPSAPPQPGP